MPPHTVKQFPRQFFRLLYYKGLMIGLAEAPAEVVKFPDSSRAEAATSAR